MYIRIAATTKMFAIVRSCCSAPQRLLKNSGEQTLCVCVHGMHGTHTFLSTETLEFMDNVSRYFSSNQTHYVYGR